ncbi:MAG: hypothetical protein HYU77_13690 [Betaproteobacteria bacterium]|nr:hypothetical protein [Betaproteobacteria bacterium]
MARPLTDAELAHWTAIYERNPILRRRGVLLPTFLTFPAEIFAALVFSPSPLAGEGWGGGHEFRPLLPRQRLVAARLAVAEQLREAAAQAEAAIARAGYVFRGGGYIEVLHHRAWPRHQARRDLNVREG